MLDAKLVISTLTIAIVVTVAINYVGREKTATSVRVSPGQLARERERNIGILGKRA